MIESERDYELENYLKMSEDEKNSHSIIYALKMVGIIYIGGGAFALLLMILVWYFLAPLD